MVPKLRFKEFCGEWDEKTIGDIAEIYKGNVLSKSDLRDEGHPCILYGELYTKYGEIIEKVYSKTNRADKNLFIGKINDVLIPSSGETAIDISTASCLKCDNVYIGGDINVIRCNNVNGSFLSYTLNHKQRNSIAKFAQGVSVVHLYGDSLRKLKINIPSLPEQTKIAHFLCTVDDKIQNQQDKITNLENIKKGFMQKIFSRKIRFKDDGGEEFSEWEEKRIGEIYIDRNEKPNKKMELLSVTINNGVIKRSDIEGKDNSSEDKSNYKVVYKGDMVYNSMRMWQGASGISSYDGIVSPAYTVMKNKVDINNVFFAYLFKQPELIFKFRRFSQGLTSDTWNLKYPQIKEIKIKIPCLKEQQKIADFLSAFDEKIDIEKETLEHLKQLKKGLLQRMFV